MLAPLLAVLLAACSSTVLLGEFKGEEVPLRSMYYYYQLTEGAPDRLYLYLSSLDRYCDFHADWRVDALCDDYCSYLVDELEERGGADIVWILGFGGHTTGDLEGTTFNEPISSGFSRIDSLGLSRYDWTSADDFDACMEACDVEESVLVNPTTWNAESGTLAVESWTEGGRLTGTFEATFGGETLTADVDAGTCD